MRPGILKIKYFAFPGTPIYTRSGGRLRGAWLQRRAFLPHAAPLLHDVSGALRQEGWYKNVDSGGGTVAIVSRFKGLVEVDTL